MPAVSMSTTGANPVISKDFFTGSVVVPAVSDTMAISCPAKQLINELLPLFLRPKMPICGFVSRPFFIRLYFNI
jgi:hypothetical protein